MTGVRMMAVPTALLVLGLSTMANAQSNCPHQAAGLTAWSTFGAGFVADEVVVIAAGQTVLLDVSPPKLTSIEIHGSLVINDAALMLDVDWIRVHATGSFIAGSASCPLSSEITITFHGARSDTGNELGNSPHDGATLGNKGLAVHSGGTIHMFGAALSPSWTRLSATAARGAQTLALEEPVNWRVGDRIVLASTDYAGMDFAEYPWEQSEDFAITAISADGRTLTLDAPLAYMHYGMGDYRAEVGLLTRNLRVQGDVSSEASLFGAHFMFRRAASVELVGVEFTRMGQLGVNGRYPVHWHVTREVGQTATYRLEDCTIHSSYQRCVTIHDTQNVLVRNNVCYDTFGHMYFLEDGSEIDNRFEHNLGVWAKPVVDELAARRLIPSDDRPAVFWVTNPANTWVDNAAASAQHGFWFAMPPRPNGATTDFYADSDIYPRFIPLQRFDNNVAHSMHGTGLLVDEMQNMDGTIGLASYTPREGGLDTGTVPAIADFTNLIAYKCRDRGFWSRGDSMRVTNANIADCASCVLMVPGPNIFENSVCIGETDNIGNADSPSWLEPIGRSRVKYYTNAWPLMGFEMYDAAGPQFMRNVDFFNFVPNDNRIAAAIGHLQNGINVLRADDRFEQITFTNSNEMFIHLYPNEFSPDSTQRDGTLSLQFNDRDGTFTGQVGAWVSSLHPAYDPRGDCTPVPEWNAMVCPPSHQPYVFLTLNNEDIGASDFGDTTISETEPAVRITYFKFGDTSKSEGIGMFGHVNNANRAQRNRYPINLPIRQGYAVYFEHPTPPHLQLQLLAPAVGEWQILAIPYPSGTTFTITRYSNIPVMQVGSLAELTRETYFFDATQELLFVRAEQWNEQAQEAFGFGYFTGWHFDAMVDIQAACPGGSCTHRSLANFVVPPALNTGEDSYQAHLEPCQAGVTSSSSGEAFFSFDPASKVLSWTIYHSIGASATGATIQFGAPGQVGAVEIDLEQGQSPIRGAAYLSRRKWIDMYEGELFVSVQSAAFAGGELRGQIGCVGTCTEPFSASAQDPCNAPGTPIDLWRDGPLDVDGGWNDWSAGTCADNTNGVCEITWVYETEALCGTSSIYLNDQYAQGAIVLNIAWPYDDPFTIDPAVYAFFQFYARGIAWDEPIELQVFLTDINEVDLTGGVRVHPDWIDNYVIEEDWTRVRIPLSALGVTSTVELRRMNIARWEWWRTTPITRQILFDQFQIVQDLPEPTTPPLGVAAVPYCDTVCAGGCTNAATTTTSPVATTTTAETTGAATTTTTAAGIAASFCGCLAATLLLLWL